MSEKIKILMIKRNMTLKQLAERIDSTPSNLSNKLRRDNFPENELRDLAQALNCEFIGNFRMKDTEEVI